MYRSQQNLRRRDERAPSRRIMAGSSLHDLLVTSTVAGFLGLGGASMAGLVQDARMTAAVNELMGNLNLARSEAIKRGTPVTVCASNTATDCREARDWNDGWLMFLDTNGNGRLELEDTVLRMRETAAIKSLRLGAWGPGTGRWVTYEADGTTKQNGTFTFCDARGTAKARAVILLGTGRPSVSVKTSKNKPLSCS